MPIALLLDILVAVLLAVTIGYAVVLNRRLLVLRQDKEELEKLAAGFAEAMARADESIRKMRGAADDLGGKLDARIEKAQALKDDLIFLVDRGNTAADRLESTVRAVRDKVPPATASAAPASPAAAPAPPRGHAARQQAAPEADGMSAKSEAERELLRALQSVR